MARVNTAKPSSSGKTTGVDDDLVLIVAVAWLFGARRRRNNMSALCRAVWLLQCVPRFNVLSLYYVTVLTGIRHYQRCGVSWRKDNVNGA